MGDKMIISGADFINVVFDEPIDDKTYDKVIDVIHDFIEGTPLMTAITKHDMTYRQFRHMLATHPEFSINFEDIILLHKDANKQVLIGELMNHIKKGSLSALKFALERMYPDDFGRRVDVHSTITNDNPAILEKYVKAEYE